METLQQLVLAQMRIAPGCLKHPLDFMNHVSTRLLSGLRNLFYYLVYARQMFVVYLINAITNSTAHNATNLQVAATSSSILISQGDSKLINGLAKSLVWMS
ncbi:hypothetical protein MNBD_GAMMA09-160 [hydrothermal vent metagenome]|uniref:Uncharacterized protein n=1 Tax=hydrothermal vent metagenome TaxID=652676 RepID=A0A3B0XGT5_9ZZZZ